MSDPNDRLRSSFEGLEVHDNEADSAHSSLLNSPQENNQMQTDEAQIEINFVNLLDYKSTKPASPRK